LALSLRLGLRAQPVLMVAAFAVTVLGAAPDALLALALSRLVAATGDGNARRIAFAAATLAALVTATWLLGLGAGRVNTRLTDRAAVDVESYMVQLHAKIPTIEHHERAEHVDRLALLRDHASALSQLYQMLFSNLGVVLRLFITVGLLASIRPWLLLLVLLAIPPVLVSDWRGKVEKRAEEAGAQAERRAGASSCSAPPSRRPRRYGSGGCRSVSCSWPRPHGSLGTGGWPGPGRCRRSGCRRPMRSSVAPWSPASRSSPPAPTPPRPPC
jgi:ATP-binding cassette subfamily B protein